MSDKIDNVNVDCDRHRCIKVRAELDKALDLLEKAQWGLCPVQRF